MKSLVLTFFYFLFLLSSFVPPFLQFYIPATLSVHMDAAESDLPATPPSPRSQNPEWTGKIPAPENATIAASTNFFKMPPEKSPGYSQKEALQL